MGPKPKRAVCTRPRLPRAAKGDMQVDTRDECPQPECKSSSSASRVTFSSNGDIRSPPVMKPNFPVKKDLKPILRVVRRLSQNALRRASGVGVRLSGDRISVFRGPWPDLEETNRDSMTFERKRRQSAAVKKKIRFRDSAINIFEISCLPDKPPGITRMPVSPPLLAEPVLTNESGNKQARTKAGCLLDKPPGITRMPVSPPLVAEPVLTNESGNKQAKTKAGRKKRTNVIRPRKRKPKTTTPSTPSILMKDIPELGDLPYTEEPQEVSDDMATVAPSPALYTPIADTIGRWMNLQNNGSPKNDANENSPIKDDNENNSSTQCPLSNDDLMDIDDLPSPGAAPVPRRRRRSFIEAERKLKELAVVKSRVVRVAIAPIRQRRYSVSSRQIPEKSLINPNMVSRAKPALRAGSPVKIDDDNLVLLSGKLKENTELNYAADFLVLETLASYRKKTLETENADGNLTLPWTQIYRPQSSKEFIGNRSTAESLLLWLSKWKKRLQRQNEELKLAKKRFNRDKYSDDDYTDDDDDDDDDNAELANLAFILGPTGVGKTCLVYALAEELGFKVIELSCSSLRNQKQILSSLEGATQTQRINLNNIAPAKRNQRPAKNAPSVTGIQKYFAAAPTKRTGRKSPPTAEVEVIEIDDKKEVRDRKHTARPMSIILFDDVDVVFEADERFWQGVREISYVARVPILMTCKDLDISCCPISDLNVEYFQLHPINTDTPAQYFRLLLLSRRISLENELEFIRFCRGFNGDLRACLVSLEFWLENWSSVPAVAKPTKRRRRAKTPPLVPQVIETPSAERVDEFDFINYELRCIQDQYDKTCNVKWPCRLLDGLKDDTPGTAAIHSREMELSHAQERFTSTFKETLNEVMPRAEELFSCSDDENARLMMYHGRMTLDSASGSSAMTFHWTQFGLDYLPTLRRIAVTDKDVKSTNSARRRMRYLHKVGLDDRSGSLQALLLTDSF